MTTRVGRILWAFALVLGAASSGACGPISSATCSANLVASFVVYVKDASTGAAICDATVTSNDGSNTETLDCYGDTTSCYCNGVFEQAGTFQITVTKPGYQQAGTTVVVKADQCHVITKKVTVELSPS